MHPPPLLHADTAAAIRTATPAPTLLHTATVTPNSTSLPHVAHVDGRNTPARPASNHPAAAPARLRATHACSGAGSTPTHTTGTDAQRSWRCDTTGWVAGEHKVCPHSPTMLPSAPESRHSTHRTVPPRPHARAPHKHAPTPRRPTCEPTRRLLPLVAAAANTIRRRGRSSWPGRRRTPWRTRP